VYRTKDGRRIAIRRATRRDVGPVAKLWQALADERGYVAMERVSREQRARWAKGIDDPLRLWAVAEIDREFVGTLTLAPYFGDLKKTRHVKTLGMGVAKAFRGLGVGSALMEYSFVWARGRRVKKIVLSVFSTNEAAIRLYEKFGFEREGVARQQFLINGRYIDEIMMGRFI